MSDWREGLHSDERELLVRSKHPDWLSPMLATLTEKRFSDADWIFERKLDGERLLAFRDRKGGEDRIRLLTRNQKSALATYPDIGQALEAQPVADFVVDGEAVAFDGTVTSFSRLQQRMQITDPEEARNSAIRVYYYVFDLLHLEGHDLDALPLRTRKRLLRQLFDFRGPIRFTPHRNEHGEPFFRTACARGWEGIIAKRAESRYRHSRSRDWLKFKCHNQQELIIAGFTEPQGERKGFGALLVGYYDKDGTEDALCYAGKVGTGYDDDFLDQFRQRLDRHRVEQCPFVDAPSVDGVHWIEPRFVGEFEFTEWTGDGKLRHPRFLGLRRDRSARDVTREGPDD